MVEQLTAQRHHLFVVALRHVAVLNGLHSDTEIAEQVGMSRSTMGKILRGEVQLSLRNVVAIEVGLGRGLLPALNKVHEYADEMHQRPPR